MENNKVLYENEIIKAVEYCGKSAKGNDYDFVVVYLKDKLNDIDIPLQAKDNVSSALVMNYFKNVANKKVVTSE